MGEVINFPQPGCASAALPAADERLSCDDVVRLEAIRDNVEAMGFANRFIETADLAEDLECR